MKGTKSVKKGIAALIIAAAMISTPGTLNANNYFANQQWLHVFSQQNTLYWWRLTYLPKGGTWQDTLNYEGDRFISFDVPIGLSGVANWTDIWLFDYTLGQYTDEMFVANLKHY